MSRLPDRAACVALRDGTVLVVRREVDGRTYCVLPGGGVEPGESPEAAAVRELAEETGLTGVVQRHLWTVQHADRRAHYFLVAVEPGPLTLGGPEAEAASDANRYAPQWLPLHMVAGENLQPEAVRALLQEVDS